MKQCKSAVVIGTGMMGPGIAATLAAGGIPTTVVSRQALNAEQAVEKAQADIALLVAHGLRSATNTARLSASTDREQAVAAADLIIESAPEDMDLKQTLFEELDRIARPDAVLASNTSGLSITAIASRCPHAERILTAHFWNPPHLMPLVEVVEGERTGHAFARWLVAVLEQCGKTAVLIKKDRPGQLGNRLQMALLREACSIVEQGIATVEEVDRAAKAGFGLRLPVYGIFEHQDAVGLDMGLGILEYVARDLYSEPRAPDFYREKVASGKLGAKAGEGFYQWGTDPGGRDIDQLKRRRDQFVLECLKKEIIAP